MNEVKWIHSEQKYAFDADQWACYADEGPQLDPIGAGDMLHDFHAYSISRHRMGNAPDDFKSLWADFQKSEVWYQYYPSQRPVQNWHRVTETEFEGKKWKAARITCVRDPNGKGVVEMFYEVTEIWEEADAE